MTNNEDLNIELYTRRSVPTLRDLLTVLFRQRWVIPVAFAVVVIGAAVSGLWVPQYEAEMKILIQHQRVDLIVTPSADNSPQVNADTVSEEELNSEVELLNSDDLLRQVVLATGLGGKPGSASDPVDQVKVAKAVRALAKNLRMEVLRKTNVISVRYSDRDPKRAAQVLSELAAAYTEKHKELHRSSGEFTFFDQQVDRFQQGLHLAQQNLTNFTTGSGVVSAEMERNSALQRADQFDDTAHQSQSAVTETEQRIRSLQSQLQSVQPRMTTVERTSDNLQLLEQLKSTLLNLELKRTDLLTTYAPTYRSVQDVDQQIAETKSAIAAEESKPSIDETTDKNPNYEWIRSELIKAQTDLSGLKARANADASASAQYRDSARHLDQSELTQQDLETAVKTQEDNYLLYVRKREEARINDALDQRGFLNVAVTEPPTVPAIPNRSPVSVAFLTLLVAGVFSVSTAFVVDFMDPTFRTPDELATYLGAPVLAALPKGER